MRDLLILLAAAGSFESLRRWHHWYLPYLILAVVRIIDRPEPQQETHRLACADLTVADSRWARATWPASRYELVHPV